MDITKLKHIELDVPKFTVDTNAVSSKLEDHPALAVFNRHRTILVSGSSGSGKSSLAVSLLTSKKKGSRVYRKRIEHYIVFIPANSLASMEKDPFTGEVSLLYNELTAANLNEAYERIQEWSEKNERTVLYIDDFAQELKDHFIERLLTIISYNSRHLKTSLIITVQTYSKCPLAIRKNVATVILFYSPNKREVKDLWHEVLNLTEEQWKGLSDYVYKTGGTNNFLLLDTVNRKFFKNFDEEITFPDTDSDPSEQGSDQ